MTAAFAKSSSLKKGRRKTGKKGSRQNGLSGSKKKSKTGITGRRAGINRWESVHIVFESYVL
jgi:hypothetical protein